MSRRPDADVPPGHPAGRQGRRHDVARRRGPRPARAVGPPGRPRRHARPDGHRPARCSASGPPPGCSATSAGTTRPTRPRSGSARRRSPTTARARCSRAVPAGHLDDDAVRAALAAQTGPLRAGAVVGERGQGRPAAASYDRVRAGEAVELEPRAVTVHRLECHRIDRPTPRTLVDVRRHVTCTAGTYVRAIARDAGAALGVGGHLTALRRTASGPFARRRRRGRRGRGRGAGGRRRAGRAGAHRGRRRPSSRGGG